MDDIVIESSSHLRPYLEKKSLKRAVKLAVAALRSHDFDTIAFRGMSGAIIAPSVAQAMGKQLILVRKPGDKTHSLLKVEGNKSAKKYVIVDDFVETGSTKRDIICAVSEFAPDACNLGLLETSHLTEERIKELAGTPYPLV